jgi:NADPH-dependent glutamate synthase beta subunit-like oxidoreductase
VIPASTQKTAQRAFKPNGETTPPSAASSAANKVEAGDVPTDCVSTRVNAEGRERRAEEDEDEDDDVGEEKEGEDEKEEEEEEEEEDDG